MIDDIIVAAVAIAVTWYLVARRSYASSEPLRRSIWITLLYFDIAAILGLDPVRDSINAAVAARITNLPIIASAVLGVIYLRRVFAGYAFGATHLESTAKRDTTDAAISLALLAITYLLAPTAEPYFAVPGLVFVIASFLFWANFLGHVLLACVTGLRMVLRIRPSSNDPHVRFGLMILGVGMLAGIIFPIPQLIVIFGDELGMSEASQDISAVIDPLLGLILALGVTIGFAYPVIARKLDIGRNRKEARLRRQLQPLRSGMLRSAATVRGDDPNACSPDLGLKETLYRTVIEVRDGMAVLHAAVPEGAADIITDELRRRNLPPEDFHAAYDAALAMAGEYGRSLYLPAAADIPRAEVELKGLHEEAEYLAAVSRFYRGNDTEEVARTAVDSSQVTS